MTFCSILSEESEESRFQEALPVPEFFGDLNLDQIIDAITIGKEEYNLKPIFYTHLDDIAEVRYRQDVMRDLDNKPQFHHIISFAKQMRTMRDHLAQVGKLYYQHQRNSWRLDAVELYCNAINQLARDLSPVDLQSRGLRAFRNYLTGYAESERFKSLLAATSKLKADLSTIKYCVLIKGDTVKVRKYESEIDYSSSVEQAFAKFQQGAVKSYSVKFSNRVDMNHIEEQILGFVAQLHSEIFTSLEQYCIQNKNYLDETIGAFDREVQFYISYLEYIARFKRTGLNFSYPQIATNSKEIYNFEGFDIALAGALISRDATIICNDFHLKDGERIMIVSGPNQGGKTTFARAFGQLHYLASLGCPVPGKKAQLFLFDKIITQFEKEEEMKNLRGKLEDELARFQRILHAMTPESIVIMNECFSSTTLADAIFLSKRVMEKIVEKDLLCVWVTFIEELAKLGRTTVSMVSAVVPHSPAVRTFKIVRRPADGLAYALSIAEKYRLTYDCLKERITL